MERLRVMIAACAVTILALIAMGVTAVTQGNFCGHFVAGVIVGLLCGVAIAAICVVIWIIWREWKKVKEQSQNL